MFSRWRLTMPAVALSRNTMACLRIRKPCSILSRSCGNINARRARNARRTSSGLIRPTPEIDARGIARADCSKENQISFLQLALSKRIVDAERYGGSGGVAVFFDV